MKIWAKTKEFFEGKFLVVRRDGSAPHWPHFVLGARDPFASRALRAYAAAIKNSEAGYDDAYVESIFELADDFDRYRLQHGDGDPDASPHRTDNPAVILAMRGCASVIEVMPDGENKLK